MALSHQNCRSLLLLSSLLSLSLLVLLDLLDLFRSLRLLLVLLPFGLVVARLVLLLLLLLFQGRLDGILFFLVVVADAR